MTEIDNGFLEGVQIIEKAHNNAYRSVNKELMPPCLSKSVMKRGIQPIHHNFSQPPYLV